MYVSIHVIFCLIFSSKVPVEASKQFNSNTSKKLLEKHISNFKFYPYLDTMGVVFFLFSLYSLDRRRTGAGVLNGNGYF